MKKLLLFTLAGLSAHSMQAQFTITEAQFPTEGDVVVWQVASASLSGISDNTNVGDAGDGVTWDFTTLVKSPGTESTDGTMTQTYVDPSTVAVTVAQTLANVAVDVNGNYSFHLSNASGFQLTGVKSTINFSGSDYEIEGEFSNDPDQMITFPFAYGDSFSDTHSGVGKGGGGLANIFSDGSRTTTADGRGTLVLSNKTFTDVIRVKSVAERKDSLVFALSNQSLGNYISNTETYSWYHEDYSRPLLSISFNTTSSGDASIDVNYLRFDCHGDAMGDAEEDACGTCAGGNTGQTPVTNADDCNAISVGEVAGMPELMIYPNPVSSNGILQVSNLVPGSGIAILDVTGKEIWSDLAIASSVTVLPVGMEPGVYFMRVSNTYGTSVKKFAVR